MAIARSLDYPRFASEVAADVVEPNEGRKDVGFEDDDEASAPEFNWLHRTTYRNVRWLDESHLGREFRGAQSWRDDDFGFGVTGNLTGSCEPGVVSRAGTRLELDTDWLVANSIDEHTFTASRDTYFAINDEREFSFVAVLNGAAAPAVPAGYTVFQTIVTDATTITQVIDRVLVGPVMAPPSGIRVSPQLTIGIGGGTPAQVFDVGPAGASSVLERVSNGQPSLATYYSRTWARATAMISEVLEGAASVHAVGNNLTDATAKQWSWAALHYTNAEEPVGLVRAAVDNTDNTVQIGGGAVHLNAATRVQFYAASTRTTTTGTLLLELQGAGNLVYMPVGTLRLGDGSAATPIATINRVNASEGGLEHSEAGSRRWLGPYTAAGLDDLVWWRFAGGVDNGVSMRMVHGTGLVQVETTEGLRIQSTGSLTVRGLRLNTHVGQESGTYDADEWEVKTKVVETNTNGNEDVALVPSTHMPQDGVFWVEVRAIGVQDTQVLNTYCRRQTSIYRRDGAAAVSFSHTIEDSNDDAVPVGGGWVNATAGISISGSDIVWRVAASDTVRRNWTLLVTFGRVRAFNS